MSNLTVLDVAKFLLNRQGEMTAMKLQKLVYYSQAWSLVWDETPLFNEKIEAWFNGPVVRDLYNQHKGRFLLSGDFFGEENAQDFSSDQLETIGAVLEYYGDKSASWLSDLTHRERPWKEARVGLSDGQRGNQEITHAAMAEYYSGL